MFDPIALPVDAMGASRPTLPPKATVRVDATIDEYILRAGSTPPPRDSDSSTDGSPWPILPLTT